MNYPFCSENSPSPRRVANHLLKRVNKLKINGGPSQGLAWTAVALASITLTGAAFAQEGSGAWTNTNGGLWGVAANWQDNTIANGATFAADFGSLNITSDVTVNLDTPRTIGGLNFGDLDITSAGGWVLGNNGDPLNILTIDGGNIIRVDALGAGKSVTVNTDVVANNGLEKQGSGTLVLNGATNLNNQVLRINDDGTLRLTGVTTGVTNLFVKGTGTIILEGNASLTTGVTANHISIGENNGDNATAILRGSAVWNHNGPDFNISDVGVSQGTMTISDSASLASVGTIFVSKNSNTIASLSVSGSSTVSTNGDIVVGRSNASNGTLNQSGGTISVTGDLIVGDNQGSKGTLIQTGGAITVGDETWIGNEGGGDGTFTKSGGEMTANNWFVVGRYGSKGVFNFNGGTLKKVNQGHLIIADSGNGKPSVGEMTMSGSADLTVDNEIWVGQALGGSGKFDIEGGIVTANNWVAVGRDGGTGVLNLKGGAFTKSDNNHLVIADGNGSVGTMTVSGTASLTVNGDLRVGQQAGSNGTLLVQGGVISLNGRTAIGQERGTGVVNFEAGTTTKSGGGNFIVADGNGSTGTMNVSGTADLNVSSQLWVGQGGGSKGTLTVKGGTISLSNWVAIGRASGTGTMNVEAGTITKTNGSTHFIVGTNGGEATGTGSVGTLNQTGGTIAINEGETWLGESGTGTWTMSGGSLSTSNLAIGRNGTGQGTFTLSGTGAVQATSVFLGQFDSSHGLLNLNGGTLSADFIQRGTGTAELNFNGAVVKARQDEADFLRNLFSDSTDIKAGGLTFDTDGFIVGINVELDGAGGITKRGAGRLDLNSGNTYTGETKVEAGVLAVNGSIGGTLSVLNGATLTGNGFINGKVTLQPGGAISAGSEFPSTLSLQSGLELSGTGGNILDFGLGTTSDLLAILGGTFLGNSSGLTTISITDAGGFAEGVYTLISWTNANGVDLTDFQLATLPKGLSGSLAFGPDSKTLQLIVVPEPSAAILLGIAGAGLLGMRRRRNS